MRPPITPAMEMRAVHRLQSMALLAGLAGLFTLVGLQLFGAGVALIVLVFVITLNWLTLDRARLLILRLHRARPLLEWEAPQLHRMLAELATRAQIPVPALTVFPSEMPNAFAIGGRHDDGVLAVSTSLLRLLGKREIQGVLAHEIAHLKNRDSVLSLAAGIFVQVIGVASQGFSLLLFVLLFSGSLAVPFAQLIPTILLVSLAPMAAVALQAGLMRARERLADQDAAALTGDPRGLASALYRLSEYSRYLTGWLRRLRFIYTSGDEGGARLLRSHPPTDERVQALLHMPQREARRIPAVRPDAAYRLVG